MNIAVIGAARSGLAAALLAKRHKHDVFLSESRPVEDFPETLDFLKQNKIDSEFGANSERALENTDLIITSPGVPRTAFIIKEAEKRKIRIISELEFAFWYCKNPIIAITGTNGKTTTTSLIAHIFNKSGRKAIVAGNIGNPLSNVVDDIEADTVIVAEVSSYQLDRIEKFKPQVGLILNITPDHLAYHGSLEDYSLTKYKIAKNHDENCLLILNADDELASKGASYTKGKVAYFSMNKVVGGIYNKNGKMCCNFPNQHNEEIIMTFDEVSIPGIHNAQNSLAAALAARAFEITNENIRDSLMTFEGVEHRLEFVRNIDGVDYINDSKATNINATWYALSSYKKPIIWIAGGRGDSNDYSELDLVVEKNVQCIIAIGEEADNIFNHFSSMLRCYRCDSLEAAVKKARDIALPSNVVLFTPACKSFDMFVNYEHRGEVFKEIVNKLT
ncbi:UDP-N-acetylmuramoyl-L-alanine--D-glutamate ligase [Bacteroidetes/Chlorobi group bacterium ChocPot_Mid]|nr:MAG: UDP-N-acetylmuramoyl-L-alanine--D-glutamate ligase [Bacteroidetes/Chlorobi group bacterium ChocPot_Mid]